jgi:hypothetical protein
MRNHVRLSLILSSDSDQGIDVRSPLVRAWKLIAVHLIGRLAPSSAGTLRAPATTTGTLTPLLLQHTRFAHPPAPGAAWSDALSSPRLNRRFLARDVFDARQDSTGAVRSACSS